MLSSFAFCRCDVLTGVHAIFVVSKKRRTRLPSVAVGPVAAPPAAKGYCAASIEPEDEFCTQCWRRQIRIRIEPSR